MPVANLPISKPKWFWKETIYNPVGKPVLWTRRWGTPGGWDWGPFGLTGWRKNATHIFAQGHKVRKPINPFSGILDPKPHCRVHRDGAGVWSRRRSRLSSSILGNSGVESRLQKDLHNPPPHWRNPVRYSRSMPPIGVEMRTLLGLPNQ